MALERPTNQPGQTGGAGAQQRAPQRRQKKQTEYAIQLGEKQKTRNAYELREKQFRGYFNQAAKFRGQTGTVLLQLLERRLDNAIFRAGLAKTRSQARQLVSHRHFRVNGKRVDIPSILVKVGDEIEAHKRTTITHEAELKPADWLKVDAKKATFKVERLPEEADLPIEFDTQKIIEFYSR
ncbi:MAG TPA: 30S ribosomal protein S4 [Candidatus Saccharimonadales bacterium]|nr:30S ribosomal protein S4 [Candidatus Saccharimonadales bacterium]